VSLERACYNVAIESPIQSQYTCHVSNAISVDICTYMTTSNEKIDLIIAVGVRAEDEKEKNYVARLLANVSINGTFPLI
jgi:hypothetical protein